MYFGQMELNCIWEKWTRCYQLYRYEILFHHPFLLSKLGLDPSVAAFGSFVISPSYFKLWYDFVFQFHLGNVDRVLLSLWTWDPPLPSNIASLFKTLYVSTQVLLMGLLWLPQAFLGFTSDVINFAFELHWGQVLYSVCKLYAPTRYPVPPPNKALIFSSCPKIVFE
jgi:hypothetical protein